MNVSVTYPNPKVSVVVISFNNQRFIDNTIRCILSQKVDFSIEIIIHDDCSSDRTPSLLAEWQRQYPDVIKCVFNQKSKGETRCFIEALKDCRGDYIAKCSPTDKWMNNKLKLQVDYMENNPECQLCYHRVSIINEESGKKKLSNGKNKKSRVLLPHQIARWEEIYDGSVLYRRSAICNSMLPTWLEKIYNISYVLNVFASARGNAFYFKDVLVTSVGDTDIGVTHLLRVQRLRRDFDARLYTLQEVKHNEELYSVIQQSLIDIIVSIIAEGELGHGLSLVPLTDVDISISELRRRADIKRKNFNKKLSIGHRLLNFFYNSEEA